MLVGADLVQAAADEGPAGAPDGERDLADGHDVPDGQRSQPVGSMRRGTRHSLYLAALRLPPMPTDLACGILPQLAHLPISNPAGARPAFSRQLPAFTEAFRLGVGGKPHDAPARTTRPWATRPVSGRK